MRLRTTVAAAFALVILAAHPLPAAGARTGPDGRAVTLITGDRVTVLSGGGVMIDPGEGREDVAFLTEEENGRRRVVPSDAVPLLGAGRLDPRLFDVDALLRAGHDGRRDHLPLIVTGMAKPRALAGGSAIVPLAAVDGYAVREERARAVSFWTQLTATLGNEGKVWLDGVRRVSLDKSVQQIGAPAAWARGLTGAAVKVAVLDSGIDAAHPDLVGKVSLRKDFTDEPDERDLVGHGTHVASIIAGSGSASQGRYRGVAPGADLLDGRVCGSMWCRDSAILAGMQWAAEQGARVVNLSLGHEDTPEQDPLEQGVEALSAQYGTLFVVAAGNEGGKVSSPATAEAALAVGAVDSSDELASFSNQGPRAGDGGLKPDLTAPGVDITAARSQHSPGSGAYVAMSGTSMSTPHAAGVAALVAGLHPEWKGEALKSALMASARPNSGLGVFAQGAGRVDADRATTQTLTAHPPSLGFGLMRWPHHDDEPVTKKVVYHNPTSAPVTLSLRARTGTVFAVSPATLTVPPGGEAEANVTADTRADVSDGLVSDYIVATGADGVQVSTPVGVEKEVESYDLTIRQTDRAGNPASYYEMEIRRLDADQEPITVLGGPSVHTVRLPKGTWLVDTTIVDEAGVTLLVDPQVRLDAPRTVEADARLGKPIQVPPPTPNATPTHSKVVYRTETATGRRHRGWMSRSFDRAFTAQLGPGDTYDGMLTQVAGSWTDGADVYRAAWFEPGRLVTGFRRAVDPKSLATVDMDYAGHLPGATGFTSGRAMPPDSAFPSDVIPEDFAIPAVRRVRVNTDGGIRWQHFLWEATPDRVNHFESAVLGYRPGTVTTERWNRGVFGPSLPSSEQFRDALIRREDVISTDLWMFGDGRGTLGWSFADAERTTLYRDGVLVGSQRSLLADFPVSPGRARYRLEAEAERGAPATLSTRVSAVWTFSSGAVQAEERLPISVVRFSPDLDRLNTAPAGVAFTIPVTVQPQPGSKATGSRELKVEVSYDDGATWVPARVHGARVLLRHPGKEGFVSLRATSTDGDGDTVEQTVIRAYRIASRAHDVQ
ncbi:S8 family serine peptidase [Microtetraspora malaysiensis]|uniref:S8 family serine peptidase n=1 Tax=Microtetraspora malaysiensis TaxID=161358 RepID=UPI003D8A0018